MDADLQQLDAIARRLRAIGQDAPPAIAKEAAPRLEKVARASAAAGTTPYGEPWAPTKEGGAPLKNAPSAISAVVSGLGGAVVTLILRGRHVFHHRGARGTVKRPILPTRAKGLPDAMRAAIVEGARAALARVMGGGR